MHRRLLALHFTFLSPADWRGAEHLLQLSYYLDRRHLAVQQFDEAMFDGVIRNGVIDCLGMLMGGALLG